MADLPQVYRRKSDGRWVAPYYDAAGKRHSAYGRTAEGALTARENKLRGYDSVQTLGRWVQWWTGVHLPRRVREGRLAATTGQWYSDKARLYLTGEEIAQVPLAKLTPQHVDDWLDELSRRRPPLASRTRQAAHATLRAALTTAVRHGLVPRNVAQVAEPPRVISSQRTVLTPQQAQTFVAATRGDRFEALWRVVLPLGLRIGEALALTLDAVDLDEGTLRIDHNLARVRVDAERVWQWKTTKTEAAAVYRLPPWAQESIARRLEVRALEASAVGEAWIEAPEMMDDLLKPVRRPLLFCGLDGRPLQTPTVSRALHRLTERAGLPRVTPHELRHSCASILIAQGASLTDVQKLLRHRRSSLTADLYTHLIAEVQEDHVERMRWLGE